MALALAIGALGNVVGTAVVGRRHGRGTCRFTSILYIVGADLIGMLVGFMLGVAHPQLGRRDRGLLRYWFVVPTLSMVLAANQSWFEKAQPWVDFNFNQGRHVRRRLLRRRTGPSSPSPALVWLVLPLAFGLWRVLRAEVK